MTRRSQRETHLARVADYLLKHGLANLSLRPLASATQTSARMLVYHFGSKERLIAAAMAEIRARQQKLVEKWGRRHPAATFAELMEFVWSWVSTPEHEPYLRLFLEVLASKRQPEAVLRRSTAREWVPGIQPRRPITWSERGRTCSGRAEVATS